LSYSSSPFFVVNFFSDRVSWTICVTNLNLPDLCPLRSWDYKCEPPAPS
jgi:hypothetical protein